MKTRLATVINDYRNVEDRTFGTEKNHIYFYHSDHLGSAQLVTDHNGDEYQRLEYTPYGETWVDIKKIAVEQVPMNFMFSAKELDKETGFYYYGARYLDPKYSRWISADPAVPEYVSGSDAGCGGIYNHINFNLYHYAGNNPIRYMDPDGRRTRMGMPDYARIASSRNYSPKSENLTREEAIRRSTVRAEATYKQGMSPATNAILDNRQKLNELRVIAKTIKSTGKAGNRDIHFAKHLRGDGCFARACIIADYLREKGYKVNYAYVNHPKMPNSEKRFKYHIAACVEIDGEIYVVDPIYNHEGEYSGLSKFEAWKNFQNPLDDIPVFPKSGILSGYDENGNVEENLHIQGFYDTYNKNKKLSVPDYAEKQLEHYEKAYNPKTGKGELEYNGL